MSTYSKKNLFWSETVSDSGVSESKMVDDLYFYGPPVTLEGGYVLKKYTVAYRTYGVLNKDASNTVWVCHALTANADVFDWWKGLFGDEALFNPQKHFIVCANILGSCYGTTGPLSQDPSTGKTYHHDFPHVTVRDIVHLHMLLAAHLNLTQIGVLIGGSLGGQQALEWALAQPSKVKRLILIATNAWHSPWGIAFNEAQRMAIEADTTWNENSDDAGSLGLMAARAVALLSYRNYTTFEARQVESSVEKTDDFLASSYQRYQGLKLLRRFNAYSYYCLSKAMDTHHIARGRGAAAGVLSAIRIPVLVIGLSSDLLFPIIEQQFLAQNIKGAELAIFDSLYGHDGFLIETRTLSIIIKEFLLKSAFDC